MNEPGRQTPPAGDRFPAGVSARCDRGSAGLQVIIIGASVRAAAHSALRAGLEPIGCDLFADRDLAAAGEAHRIPARYYPQGFEPLLAQLIAGVPWLYTGALENHPELLDRLAEARPLWGNRGSSLRAARDPLALAANLKAAGLPHPLVRLDPQGLPRDGSWLAKPLASAGGRDVAFFFGRRQHTSRACYFQERIEGEPLSAVFVAMRPNTVLAGVTWQWLGKPGAPFAFRGSIGPYPLSPATNRRVAQLGRAIASAFGLVGLFGVDFILRDAIPWPVEVNPRYTASVEVLELATGQALLAQHCQAFDRDSVSQGPLKPAQRDRTLTGVVGKAIVFAAEPCEFPERCLWRALQPDRPFSLPRLADIPRAGTRFKRGEPVITLLEHAPDLATCRARLTRRLRHWQQRLAATAVEC